MHIGMDMRTLLICFSCARRMRGCRGMFLGLVHLCCIMTARSNEQDQDGGGHRRGGGYQKGFLFSSIMVFLSKIRSAAEGLGLLGAAAACSGGLPTRQQN
ncbi:hypothetical protein AMECASPLE_028746 [Ameca splendens]|uniref:Secreted protein n=1 Tax=Ameca splendens TaxID=208324 RepID=A0ABV0XIJ6_9TELE